MIVNKRRQYAVGQGCFHAGLIGFVPDTGETHFDFNGELKEPGICYVYDCGSLQPYAKQRDYEVARFHRESGKRTIDLLYLSHMHEDHVSGVEYLCDLANGSRVDTVVLPLLNSVDRLICFARAVAEDAAYQSEFFEELVADPVAALSRFNPRQIIFVRRRDDIGPPPLVEPRPDSPAGPGDREGGLDETGHLKWRMVGLGRVERRDAVDVTSVASRAVFEVDDTLAFQISGREVLEDWLLLPYVDVEISLARDAFILKAAELFGLSVEDFEAAASNASWLLDKVKTQKAALAAAYKLVGNLNVTSLCLYSGPARPPKSGYWRASTGKISTHGQKKYGWFGTGDADLRTPARRNAFLAHYRSQLSSAVTLLLPHHGSENNFDPALVDAIEPFLSIASADRFSTWQHPGSWVVQNISSRGLPLFVVTSSSASSITEVTGMTF